MMDPGYFPEFDPDAGDCDQEYLEQGREPMPNKQSRRVPDQEALDDPLSDFGGGSIYDPTDPMWMATLGGQEIPEPEPYELVSGNKHLRFDDLRNYLGPPESGGLTLSATIPLLNRDRTQPLTRKAFYGVDINWPSRQRAAHIMVVGKTGDGKNNRVINDARHSAIADPGQIVVSISLKANDFGPIMVACQQHDKRLMVVNFDNPERSLGYNPLQRVDGNSSADAIRRFAEITRNPFSHDSEFWTQMVRMALQGAWEEGIRSFPEIYRLYSLPKHDLLEKLKQHNNRHSKGIVDFFSSPNVNADTAWATILGGFTPFAQESVRRVMSRDELDLPNLFRQPVCLHIEVSEPHLETQLPLVQLLVRDLTDQLIETAEQLGEQALPVTLFIDDLPALGKVMNEQRLLTLRERKIGVVAGVQSLEALTLVSGENYRKMVNAFANHIVLPGCAQEDAEYFSYSSGDQMVSIAFNPTDPPHYLKRSLLSAADIRSPGYEHPLLGKPATFLLGPRTFQAYLQHWHETPVGARVLKAARGITGKERLRKDRLPDPMPRVVANQAGK